MDRVLIVGAGPVGLVAAAYLAGEGIRVTLFEASEALPEDLRASTFHPATLDLLDRFGVVETLIEQGLVCRYWQFRDRQEGEVATFDMGLLANDTRHPYRLQCEQWKLTRLLRSMLESNPEVNIHYQATARHLVQDDEGVTLSVAFDQGEEKTFRGRYLIGADGARSMVRKAMNVAFDGITIPEVYLSLSTRYDFGASIRGLANIAYVSDPDEWLVLLRTPSLWRVLLPTDAALSEAEIKDPERVEARLQAMHQTRIPYEIVHATAYRVHERVASNYVAGRVFLAGDAAHLNNPLGGMGMNGGVQDAMNLAEKLTAVWRGEPRALMGRYERQRRTVALETVQAQSLRNRRMLNERSPEARRAYHDELRRTVDDPKAHREYLLRSSMIQSLRDAEAVA